MRQNNKRDLDSNTRNLLGRERMAPNLLDPFVVHKDWNKAEKKIDTGEGKKAEITRPKMGGACSREVFIPSANDRKKPEDNRD